MAYFTGQVKQNSDILDIFMAVSSKLLTRQGLGMEKDEFTRHQQHYIIEE